MTRIQRPARERIAVVAATLALACGGDGGPVGNPGSIQLAVNPTTLPIQQGGSGTVTASLTRGGGFTGVVALAVTGLPTGITSTITPGQLSGTITTATVNVTADATVAAQTYSATVAATAQGVGQATATYQVIVTAPPDYSLSVVPSAVTIAAGASGNATVAIARTNFTGEVSLALQNPPPGISGAFTPTSTAANASSLVVSVAASVLPGSYPLTVQGTATGPGIKTTSLTITVTAKPAGSTSVEYQYCDADAAPVFFAYQDGTGAWQPVTGSTSAGATKFAFKLDQSRGGVLAVFQTASSAVAGALNVGAASTWRRSHRPLGIRDRVRAHSGVAAGRDGQPRSSIADSYETDVWYASAAELAQDGIDNCAITGPTKRVTGTVAGVSAGQYGILSLGGVNDLFIGGTSTNPVTFTDVPTGPVDFIGTRMTSAGTPPDKLFLLRNLNIPDGGSLPSTIDFGGPALAPATATATMTGGAGDDLEIFTELVTANGRSLMWFDLAPSTLTARPWAGIPASAMVTGDFHALVVFATPRGSKDFRVSLEYVGPVANQSLVLGPSISAPTITQVVGGNYPRFRFQGTFSSDYNKGASLDVASAVDGGNVLSMIATGAYLTGSGNALAYDFIVPDVVGLAGFPLAARLTAGANDVSASAFGFTGPGIFDLQPNLGSEFKAAAKAATINVP
jgi:hypothetical protein